ncbi:FGGY family carbohydrate kinase, partial [Blautia pseudococcoides]|nr:FGGY family carbohydrate kinase [Blautia pseudococcoides]
MERYILGIDQSTQGTKALLFDGQGALTARADLPHRQIIDSNGWVEHDPEEIYRNTIQTVKNVVEKAGIDKNLIAGAGISNQRETALAWKKDGRPVYNA